MGCTCKYGAPDPDTPAAAQFASRQIEGHVESPKSFFRSARNNATELAATTALIQDGHSSFTDSPHLVERARTRCEEEIPEIDYESLPDTYSLSAHLFAGALAGIAEHALIFPMDTIKVTSLQVIVVFGRLSNQNIDANAGLGEFADSRRFLFYFFLF